MITELLFMSLFFNFFTLPTFSTTTFPQDDATSLLSFKQKADGNNKLVYSSDQDHCKWQGVKCSKEGRVTRYDVQGLNLFGFFPPNSLSRLDQLRIMSLRNNSLFGPIPDLSPLVHLKSLYLDYNNFSGSFPPSIIFLNQLVALSLSHNNLTGSLSVRLTLLDRLIALRLDSNHFSGPLPPLNQSHLNAFNVSNNNLTGPVPYTKTLSRFKPTLFAENPGLCGEIVHKHCGDHHARSGILVGFTIAIVVLTVIFIIIVLIALFRNKYGVKGGKKHLEMVNVRRH